MKIATLFSDLFPSYQYEFKVDLSEEEIVDILKNNIQSAKIRIGVLRKESDKLFEGEINKQVNQFKFRKITYQAQSFKPEVLGEWMEDEKGHVIKINMKINQTIERLIMIVAILSILTTVAIIIFSIFGTVHFLTAPTPILFVFFFLVLVHIGFDLGKSTVKKDLDLIFNRN